MAASRMDRDEPGSSRVTTPHPDPTTLTTEQLTRGLAGLREIIETRLSGMDEAIRLLQTKSDKSPSIDVVAGEVAHLKELVLVQFGQRDIALAAALAAQKEAAAETNKTNAAINDKTERNLTKLIEGQTTLSKQETSALQERLNKVENELSSINSAKIGSHEGGMTVGNIVSWAAAAMMLLLYLSTFFPHAQVHP